MHSTPPTAVAPIYAADPQAELALHRFRIQMLREEKVALARERQEIAQERASIKAELAAIEAEDEDAEWELAAGSEAEEQWEVVE